jgi:hypothetical protein
MYQMAASRSPAEETGRDRALFLLREHDLMRREREIEVCYMAHVLMYYSELVECPCVATENLTCHGSEYIAMIKELFNQYLLF